LLRGGLGSRDRLRPAALGEGLGEDRYRIEQQVEGLLFDDWRLAGLRLRGSDTNVDSRPQDKICRIANVAEIAAVAGKSVRQSIGDSSADVLGKTLEVENTLLVVEKSTGRFEESGA
jgi:hypothetical protein